MRTVDTELTKRTQGVTKNVEIPDEVGSQRIYGVIKNLTQQYDFPQRMEDKVASWAHLGLEMYQIAVSERQQSKRVYNIDKKMTNVGEQNLSCVPAQGGKWEQVYTDKLGEMQRGQWTRTQDTS